MSDSIGKVLKEKRESLGLTIEQVAEETKIQKRYINDMETENFDDMPGKVYEKGFLKTYVNLLGIDVDYALDLYELHRYGEKEVEEIKEEPKEKENKGKSKGITLLFGGVLLIIVGIIGFKFLILDSDKKIDVKNDVEEIVIDEVKNLPEVEVVTDELAKLSEGVDNKETEEVIEEAQEVLVVEKEEAVEEVASSAKQVEEVEVREKELVLLVKGDSWVEVSKNGKRVYFDMAKDKEIKVLGKETDKIYVKVGDGSQVELVLNGENKGLLGKEKEVFKKTF